MLQCIYTTKQSTHVCVIKHEWYTVAWSMSYIKCGKLYINRRKLCFHVASHKSATVACPMPLLLNTVSCSVKCMMWHLDTHVCTHPHKTLQLFCFWLHIHMQVGVSQVLTILWNTGHLPLWIDVHLFHCIMQSCRTAMNLNLIWGSQESNHQLWLLGHRPTVPLEQWLANVWILLTCCIKIRTELNPLLLHQC